MHTLILASRRTAIVGALLAVLFVAGCGGGAGGAPNGGLFVAADFGGTLDEIYRVTVTEELPPFATFTYDYTSSPPLWIATGDAQIVDHFLPGSYTVEVFWTDGVTFPTFAETRNLVDVTDGADTTVHFSS